MVPEDELVAFARKWDPQPFHTDPERARGSQHGGLIAPTAYTYAIATALTNQLDPAIVPIAGVEQKLRLVHPVRPGDRLVATVECVHKRLSRTKPDRGIARVVTTVRNQEDQAVLLWESTFLVPRMPRPG